MLVNGLPADSATFAKDQWSTEHQLLAALIQMTDMWGRLNAIVGGAKPSKLPKPVRIRTPGDEQEKPPNVMSVADFARHYRETRGGEA